MKALLSLIIFLLFAFSAFAGEIKIHSNGNLKPILMEISHYFQTRHPEGKVTIETGKVSEIQEKLEAQAAGDLLIGDEKLFEMGAEIKAIDNASRSVLFTDPMVAVADVDSDVELTDPKELNADNFKKIALTGEKTPLGKLVRAYLNPRGLKDAPAEKKVDVADAKAALDAVKTGEAKWTLVYSSDASRRRLKHLFRVPAADIPEVTFSVAIISHSQNKEEAAKFIEALQSTISKKFYENAGFVVKGSTSGLISSSTKSKKQTESETQTQTGPQTQTSPQTQTQTAPQTQNSPQTQSNSQQKAKTEKKAEDDQKKKKKKKKDKDKD